MESEPFPAKAGGFRTILRGACPVPNGTGETPHRPASGGAGAWGKAKRSSTTPKLQTEKTDLPRELSPAGFWIRFLAWTIDFLLLLFATLGPVWLILMGKPNLEELLPKIGYLVYYIIFILPTLGFLFNKVFLTVKCGGGIGKLICGLIVTDEDGKLLKVRQAIFRYLVGYFVSGMLFGLGFLWILRDPQRQGWHDQVSGTFVVVKNKKQWAIGAVTVFLLVLLNVMLSIKAVQSIKENIVLQDDTQNLMEIMKQSLLENDKAPATIEPQEAPTII